MRFLPVVVLMGAISLLPQANALGNSLPTAVLTAVAVAGAALFVELRLRAPRIYYTPEPGSLSDKVILITGGTSGLGLESAKRLAVGGARVIVTARSQAKGEEAVNDVQTYLQKRNLSNPKVSYKILHLDDFSAIRKAVKSWNDVNRVDVLMNNAGVMGLYPKELTVDGFERQMQTNHLGHFLLTALLARKFASKARIINVSSDAYKFSYLARGLDFNYIWKAVYMYTPFKSYSQSKLANIFFTQEFQRRIEKAGLDWTTVALHPGTVATGLARHFFFGEENYEKFTAGNASVFLTFWASLIALLIKTPARGASTQVWLASIADVDASMKGKYFSDCKVQKLWEFASDKEAAARLWTESEDRVGTQFRL